MNEKDKLEKFNSFPNHKSKAFVTNDGSGCYRIPFFFPLNMDNLEMKFHKKVEFLLTNFFPRQTKKKKKEKQNLLRFDKLLK